MGHYVAVYTINATKGIGKGETIEYRFEASNDLRAGDEAIRYYVERYYVGDSFARPPESRFFPVRSCLRPQIMGTFDDIFLEELGKQKRICRFLFAVPKEEHVETRSN